MRHALVCALAGVCLFTNVSWSGPRDRAGAGAIYERIVCVVPMIGAGTLDDPKRPLFTPIAGKNSSDLALDPLKKSKGFIQPPVIVAYHSMPTDDGHSAIVEFVARDRAAFEQIFTNGSVKVFDRQNTKAIDLLKELRKFKKDFDLTQLEAGTL